MAESADRSNLTERYTAIEQAYCADQWGAVIEQGQDLLRQIPRTSGPVPEGLKERVQLLMAHAHLYGFQERDVAEDLYSDVLHSKAELALRQIAEQGLQQCSLPLQAQAGGVETERDRETSPEPAVEPAPAQPQSAGESPQPAASEPGSVLAESLDGEAAATPSRSQATAATAATTTPTALPDAETSAADPFLMPSATETAAATPAAASHSLAMPWLVAGAGVTVAAAAPSSQSESAPTPWATAAAPIETPLDLTPTAQARAEASTPPQTTAAVSEAVETPAAQPALEEATLIPEVVEEPELFEVHQADPNLAEELDLTVMEPVTADRNGNEDTLEPRPSSLSATAAIASAAVLEAEAKQQGGTKATAASQAWQETGAIEPEPTSGSTPWPQETDERNEPQSLLTLTKDSPEAAMTADTVCELFRDPPAPVEEEDQELLLGLLRVLVSAESAGDGG